MKKMFLKTKKHVIKKVQMMVLVAAIAFSTAGCGRSERALVRISREASEEKAYTMTYVIKGDVTYELEKKHYNNRTAIDNDEDNDMAIARCDEQINVAAGYISELEQKKENLTVKADTDGKIIEISDQAISGTVSNTDGLLTLASGDDTYYLETEEITTLAVGSGAVISEGLSRYVYVRKDGEDIEKRTVEVGYSNGNYTEIKYGLTEDDEVYYPLNQFYPVNYKEMEIATGDVAVGAMSKFILGKNSKIKGYYTDFPGQLQEICVSQDDEVKKGDLLFTYTTENTSAKIKEVTESIKVLKENHSSTLEMYEGMKEAYEQNDTGVSTIGAAEGATAGDAFSKEKHDLNFEIIDYRIQIENVNYDYSLKTLTAKYNELTKDNDGSGLISVYAESDGIIKNVDDEAVVGKVFKGRQYIVSIAEPGVNETLVQMREMKTSAYGDSEPEPTGDFKSAPVGKALNVKIGDQEILLADEPTGAVDSKTSDMIQNLFRKLNRERGITVIIVTHDISLANKVDRVVMISDGRVTTEKIMKEKYKENISALSTENFDMSVVHEEFSVLDKAGRLKLSDEIREQTGLTSSRVKVEVIDGKVVISGTDSE